MSTEEMLIAVVRIAGALFVLRWALFGSVFAIAIDLSDLFLMNLLNLGGVSDYQSFDKTLDLAYMATFLVVALRWAGIARNIAIALFVFRLVGVLLFDFSGNRWVLLGFPNIFEFWIVWIAFVHHFRPNALPLSLKQAAPSLIALSLLKELHEFVLHGGRWLDQYRAVDVVHNFWKWLTPG